MVVLYDKSPPPLRKFQGQQGRSLLARTRCALSVVVVVLRGSLAWQVTRVSPYVRRPFPPRRPGEYRKGMIPARPLY